MLPKSQLILFAIESTGVRFFWNDVKIKNIRKLKTMAIRAISYPSTESFLDEDNNSEASLKQLPRLAPGSFLIFFSGVAAEESEVPLRRDPEIFFSALVKAALIFSTCFSELITFCESTSCLSLL